MNEEFQAQKLENQERPKTSTRPHVDTLSFKAGCVKDHIDNWRSVTTDPVILDAIKPHHIAFEGGCRPVQATKPKQITFSSGEKEIISPEKVNLLNKGVIELIFCGQKKKFLAHLKGIKSAIAF